MPAGGGRRQQVDSATGEINRPGGSSSIGSAAAAGGIALVTAGATIFINAKLEEHFREYRAEGARELTDQAIAGANPEFLREIELNRRQIQTAHEEGRLVYLNFTVETAYTDTTDRDPIVGSGLSIGDVAYVAHVRDVQIVYEGEMPKPYEPDTNWAGDLVRDIIGVTLKYRSNTVEIKGVNKEVRGLKALVKEVEATLSAPGAQFEELVVKTHYAGLPKDKLRDGEPAHPPWARMEELEKKIAALREDILLEKRLLQDLGKL